MGSVVLELFNSTHRNLNIKMTTKSSNVSLLNPLDLLTTTNAVPSQAGKFKLLSTSSARRASQACCVRRNQGGYKVYIIKTICFEDFLIISLFQDLIQLTVLYGQEI